MAHVYLWDLRVAPPRTTSLSTDGPANSAFESILIKMQLAPCEDTAVRACARSWLAWIDNVIRHAFAGSPLHKLVWTSVPQREWLSPASRGLCPQSHLVTNRRPVSNATTPTRFEYDVADHGAPYSHDLHRTRDTPSFPRSSRMI